MRRTCTVCCPQSGREKQSIVADTSAEHALPLVALESLHIPLGRIAVDLVKHAGDALLNGRSQIAEIPFASSVSSQTQLMFDPGPWCCFAFADLFDSVPHLLRFLGRQGIVGLIGYGASGKDGHIPGETLNSTWSPGLKPARRRYCKVWDSAPQRHAD
jgi:hypothetical protein